MNAKRSFRPDAFDRLESREVLTSFGSIDLFTFRPMILPQMPFQSAALTSFPVNALGNSTQFGFGSNLGVGRAAFNGFGTFGGFGATNNLFTSANLSGLNLLSRSSFGSPMFNTSAAASGFGSLGLGSSFNAFGSTGSTVTTPASTGFATGFFGGGTSSAMSPFSTFGTTTTTTSQFNAPSFFGFGGNSGSTDPNVRAGLINGSAGGTFITLNGL